MGTYLQNSIQLLDNAKSMLEQYYIIMDGVEEAKRQTDEAGTPTNAEATAMKT
jgi:hypothetical protein